MKESPIARRRAVEVIAASALAIGVFDILFSFSMMARHEAWSAIANIAGWWASAATIIFIAGLAYFSRHTEQKWATVVGWLGVAIAALSLLGTGLYATFPQLFIDISPFLKATPFIAAAAVLQSDDFEKNGDALAKAGFKLSPYLIGITPFIAHSEDLSPTSMGIVGGSLVVFGICAWIVRSKPDGEVDVPDGVGTESGALLVITAIGARVALMVAAAVTIAFHGMPDVMMLASVCSAIGVVTVPAALGASRFRQEIVREAHPAFRRAAIVWWGAIGFLILQLIWIWVSGPTLISFIPACAALVADVIAWESLRRGLQTWGEQERISSVEVRARAARIPVLAGGVVLLAGYAGAFFSTTVASAGLFVGGLIAFIGSYLMLQTLIVVWDSLRDTSYI